MPCYTTRTITLDFKAADAELLAKAMDKAGLRAHGVGDLLNLARRVVQTGQISFTGSTMTEAKALELAGATQRAYAAEVVQYAAKRFGFNVKASQDQRQFTLTKRSF
jgi:hypothetical protein